MIPAETVFQLYLAVKAHFFTERYDVLEYAGRIKNSGVEYMEERNDAGLFRELAKRFNSKQEAATFMVANMAYGNSYPMTDLEKAFEQVKQWQKRKQSLTKTFKDDLATMVNSGYTFKELFHGDDKNMPRAFAALQNRKVSIESLAIIDKIENFTGRWSKQYPFWKAEVLRIRKLGSFVKVDATKFGNLYYTMKEELKADHAQL